MRRVLWQRRGLEQGYGSEDRMLWLQRSKNSSLSLGCRFEVETIKDGAGDRQILIDLGCFGKEWELQLLGDIGKS